MKKLLCVLTMCALTMTANAGETDWEKMSRKALDAVQAVKTMDAPQPGAQSCLQSLFVRAAADGRTDIMAWLTRQGADLNAAGPDGITAFHAAAAKGNTGVLEWLRDNGADVGGGVSGNTIKLR